MSAPICAPGTSRVVAGFDITQILLGDAIGDALVALGMPELAAVFAAVGVVQFALDVVCAQDPPPLPTIDANRLKAYYDSLSSDAYPLILADAQNLLGHYLWYQWCECVGAPTPPKPAPTPLPPGVSLDRSPVPPSSPSSCYNPPQRAASGTTNAAGDFTWTLAGDSPLIGINTQWFSVRQVNGQVINGQHYPATNFMDQLDAAGAVLRTDSWTYLAEPVAEADLVRAIPRVANATGLSHRTHVDPGLGHTVFTEFLATQVCAPLPPSLRQDCCPPDPELENLIIQVLRLEQLILQSLGGSTAYTRGTVHLGLTGSGSLAVGGLRGVAVEVTAGTPTTPQLGGNPPYQWDLGWMSVLTGDGMIEERRLTRQHQVWLPSSMPLATTFGFFLFPGVVATVTELDPV